MNKIFFLSAFTILFSGLSALAQSKTEVNTPATTTTVQNEKMKHAPEGSKVVTPPEEVDAKFKSLHATVTEVKWLLNKQFNYVAIFKSNGNECRTVFKSDGTVIREVTVIPQSSLPVPVSAYLTKNYAGKTPKKCEQFKNDNGKMIFIVKFDDKMIWLDADGNEIKQVQGMEKSE